MSALWGEHRQVSERTDPDYTEKAERRFLEDLLTLSRAELEIALGGYGVRKRKEVLQELAGMRRRGRRKN